MDLTIVKGVYMFEIKSLVKFSQLAFVIGSLSLFSLPFNQAYAVSGCCSGHGGVAKCDTASGYQVCKDGSQSACTCEKAKDKTGCCSGHGGVAGCDKASGYQVCKDGTKSPTCKCK